MLIRWRTAKSIASYLKVDGMKNMGNNGDGPDHWYQFREALKSRTSDPSHHPSYWGYFLVGVLLLGGLGIWVEILRIILSKNTPDLTSLCVAINVFYPSLGCASALQFVWGEYPKMLRALAIVMCGLFVVPCVLIAIFGHYTGWVLFWEIILSLISLWSWWITNADNRNLLDPDPPTAYGPSNATEALGGTLQGFKVI